MLVKAGETLSNRSAAIPIEEILSSKGRIKIIKVLLRDDELNISEIARSTRLNHNSVVQHLDLLKRAGLVHEKNFGRIRIYSIRNESLIVKAMKSFMSLWNQSKMETDK